MDTYKFCGVALICALAAFLLRNIKKEFELPLTLTGSAMLIGAALMMAEPILGYIKDLGEQSPLAGDAVETLMRVMGIAMLVRIACDICREMGAPGVAMSLETVAKFEIIILSLPLVGSLLDSIKALFAQSGL